MTASRADPNAGAGGQDAFRERFISGLRSLGIGEQPLHLLVAVSGGVDSVVLLHLLRFTPGLAAHTLTVAHFDHRMRPGSPDDAKWVRGLCRAWRIPARMGAATTRLAGETQARQHRYQFLRETADEVGARSILTAHHADDQAETVLFRILRGTGIRGLAGIPARGDHGILRPLLPFWREEILAYATATGLRWRVDPTNESRDPSRNRIRLALLPEIERHVAPGARRNLVVLAELARESEDGWREIIDRTLGDVADRAAGEWSIDRIKMRELHPALASRLLRTMLESSGLRLSRSGTRSALQFITDAPSGRKLQLPSGVRIDTEFDRAVVRVDAPDRAGAPGPGDAPLVIRAAWVGEGGEGELVVGGRKYRVRVQPSGREEAPDAGWRVAIPISEVRLPLQLRGREQGDRIRTRHGTRTLKKLMIDRRVPRSERAALPVLADAAGRVLWVGGLAIDRDLETGDGDLVVDIVADD